MKIAVDPEGTEFHRRMIANALQRGWSLTEDNYLEKDIDLDEGHAELLKSRLEAVRP